MTPIIPPKSKEEALKMIQQEELDQEVKEASARFDKTMEEVERLI